MKKTIITFVLLSISSLTSFSQRISYDDIIKKIQKNEFVKAYSLLFEFQEKNPEFANTYFQLGNISYIQTINSHPVKDKERIDYLIYNCRLFYNLCNLKLSAQTNDARKNEDYYKTISEFQTIKKLENLIVQSYIDNQIKKINEIENKTNKGYHYFSKFTNSYNSMVHLYNVFLTKFSNENNICLYPKDSVFQLTTRITKLFDSTIYYFEQYQNTDLKSIYPNFQKQKIKIQDISYYMLDGAIRTNLLADEIILWNYKKWASDIQKQLTNSITHLRETIAKTYKELNKYEAQLITFPFSNNYPIYEIEPQVFFEIEKYDPNSIITSLFIFRKNKIDLLTQTKKTFNDTTNTKNNYQSKLIEYQNFIIQKQQTSQSLNNLKIKINENNYLSHKEFFDFFFKNYSFLAQYPDKQTITIDSIFNKVTYNINYITLRDKICSFSNCQKNKRKIPFYINPQSPLLSPKDTSFTLSIIKNKNNTYATGFTKSNNNSQPFIILNQDTNEVFFKTLSSNNNEAGISLSAYSSGVWVVTHNFDKNQNSIYNFDNSGKQIIKNNLNFPQYVRNSYYDEINNYLIFVANGYNTNYLSETNDTLIVSKYDPTKNSILWIQKINIKGKVIDILKFDTTFHLIANFTHIKYQENQIQSNQNSIIDIVINENGKIIDFVQINKPEEKQFYAISVSKIDNQSFILFATQNQTNIYNTTTFKIMNPKIYNINKKEIMSE